MSRIVKTFQKTTEERRRLKIDYTCWLEETETLVDNQIGISPYTADVPLTISSGYADVTNKQLVIFVGGGRPGQNYVVSLIMRTSDGQTKRDDIGIRVLT